MNSRASCLARGALPGVRVADKVLAGARCIRLDTTVIPAHSEKEGAEPNFKGFGHHPLVAGCDNTGEDLAGMLRKGSAGSNTAADHITVLDAAIEALPPRHRRRLMVTTDGAGASAWRQAPLLVDELTDERDVHRLLDRHHLQGVDHLLEHLDRPVPAAALP